MIISQWGCRILLDQQRAKISQAAVDKFDARRVSHLHLVPDLHLLSRSQSSVLYPSFDTIVLEDLPWHTFSNEVRALNLVSVSIADAVVQMGALSLPERVKTRFWRLF